MQHYNESRVFNGYYPTPTYAPNTNSMGGNLYLNEYSATHNHYHSNNSPPTLPHMMGGLSSTSDNDMDNTPQNLRDSPERRAKVKTEMCTYYMKGGVESCPYGNKCECIICLYYYVERKDIVSYFIKYIFQCVLGLTFYIMY